MVQQVRYKDIPEVKSKIMLEQKDLCQICKRELVSLKSKDICLDHNHKTGRIRGVLCRGCNSMEGKVYRAFVRVGLKNQGVDYFNFLYGLACYYVEYEDLQVKGTDLIHPKYKFKKDKKEKTKRGKNEMCQV